MVDVTFSHVTDIILGMRADHSISQDEVHKPSLRPMSYCISIHCGGRILGENVLLTGFEHATIHHPFRKLMDCQSTVTYES